MEYIRETYGVLARRGMTVKIKVPGGFLYGTITSAKAGCLMIKTAGSARPRKYHPTSGIEYVTEANQEKGHAE